MALEANGGSIGDLMIGVVCMPSDGKEAIVLNRADEQPYAHITVQMLKKGEHDPVYDLTNEIAARLGAKDTI